MIDVHVQTMADYGDMSCDLLENFNGECCPSGISDAAKQSPPGISIVRKMTPLWKIPGPHPPVRSKNATCHFYFYTMMIILINCGNYMET